MSQNAAERVDRGLMRTFSTGSGIAVGGRLVGAALRLGVQVLLARFLGPALFGVYAIGWSALRVTGTLSMFGLHNGVTRFAAVEWKEHPARAKTTVRRSVVLAMMFGCLTGLGLFLLAPWLENSVFEMPGLAGVLRLVAVALPLVSGSQVAASAIRASQKMRYSILAEDLIQPAANLLLVLALLALGAGLNGAMLALGLAFACSLGASVGYLRRLLPQSTGRPDQVVSVGALLAYSLPTAMAGTLGNYMPLVDRFFLGALRTDAEVGTYQVVSQFPIPFIILLTAFNVVLAPMAADLYHRGSHDELHRLFRISTKWGLYLSLPYFLLIVFAGKELILLVFGPAYLPGHQPLMILATAGLFNVGTGAVGILLTMTGHQKRWLAITGVSLVANVGLNLVLVPRFGMVGAAFATGLSMSAMMLVGVAQVWSVLRLWAYDRRYLKGAVAGLATAAALAALRLVGGEPSALRLLVAAAVAGGVFLGALLLLGLDGEDRHFLEMVTTRFGRRSG